MNGNRGESEAPSEDHVEPETGTVAVPARDVDEDEWQGLVTQGWQQGSVHAEDVTLVLRNVELTGEVLDRVQHVLRDAAVGRLEHDQRAGRPCPDAARLRPPR